ncbi:hypothetical protein SAMN04515617_101314 [Collimonas sp. OK242]|nr:hypothetical protein SAMN04515617_101314 [Collimonas sp. OK242]
MQIHSTDKTSIPQELNMTCVLWGVACDLHKKCTRSAKAYPDISRFCCIKRFGSKKWHDYPRFSTWSTDRIVS